MRYFHGEIFVTHKKTWLGWIKYKHLFTTDLIEAEDWLVAKRVYDDYANKTMANKLRGYKYITCVSSAIK